MMDPISRQAAIDVVKHAWAKNLEPTQFIEDLPSVQPEIIMCRDCRWQKDQSGSTAWLPCMALVTPSDFYCGRAERRTDD